VDGKPHAGFLGRPPWAGRCQDCFVSAQSSLPIWQSVTLSLRKTKECCGRTKPLLGVRRQTRMSGSGQETFSFPGFGTDWSFASRHQKLPNTLRFARNSREISFPSRSRSPAVEDLQAGFPEFPAGREYH
jgi:hypothetical protein